MSEPTSREIRNQEFLTSTGIRDFDQLKASLDEAGDAFSFIVLPASMQRSAPTPPVYHNAFQADLRVRKLYEEMARMPAEDASQEARELFDEHFASYQQKWEGSTIRPERDHYAVAAALFLCSEFCNSDDILSRIDAWTNWYEQNKGISTHFDRRARILPLFLMNTYCDMLIKSGTPIESVNALIEGLEETTRIKESVRVSQLQKWDSVSKDDASIAAITVIPGWSKRVLLEPELYDSLNTFLRATIESN